MRHGSGSVFGRTPDDTEVKTKAELRGKRNQSSGENRDIKSFV